MNAALPVKPLSQMPVLSKQLSSHKKKAINKHLKQQAQEASKLASETLCQDSSRVALPDTQTSPTDDSTAPESMSETEGDIEQPIVANIPAKRGRPAVSIENTIGYMMWETLEEGFQMDSNLEDIITGISRLDWYGRDPKQESLPLSKRVLKEILCHLDLISVESVIEQTGLAKRQAERYVQACRLIITNYERYLAKQDAEEE